MSNSPARRRAHREQADGFTLLEVVVALAIAAIGLGFLMSAARTGLDNAGLAYRYVEATRRAQSHLAEIGASVPLVAGVTSGDDGDGFRWSTRISPPVTRAAPGQAGMARAGLYTIEVSVSWRDGLSSRSLSLRTQRIGGT